MKTRTPRSVLRSPRPVYSFFLFALLALGGLFAGVAQAQVNHLVISQVYGGGGNALAPYSNDFVVLFNPTGATVNVNGWSVQYASATGLPSAGTSTNLPNANIPAGGYFLIQMASGGAVGSALTGVNHSATGINMSATNGKVYLVNSTALITACPPGATAIDYISFGTGNCAEGTAASAGSNTTALIRAGAGCVDTNNNSTDFAVGAPVPRNSSTPANYCYPTQLVVTSISPASPTAGVAFSVTVEARNAGGIAQGVLSATTINLSNTGGGLISGTTSGVIAMGGTSVTISGVMLSAADPAATITATRSAGQLYLTAGTSAPFVVQGGAANDCNGVPGGPDVPGTPCDDANACTINDTWDAGCNCLGTFQDSDGDGTCDANDGCPNDPLKIAPLACGCGNLEVGQACSDGNLCTTGDVITACGVCTGTPLPDGDGDGTCDAQDGCPADPNKIAPGVCGCGNPEPGALCDDGNAATVNDQITAGCVCAGIPPSIYWSFGAVTGTDVRTTNLIPNTTVSVLDRGNNNGTSNALITTTSPSSVYASASGTNNAGVAARIGPLSLAINSTAYFEFTVTSAAGFAVTISRIEFGSRSTGTGPAAYTLRSSLDAFATDVATGTMVANSAWAYHVSPAFAATSLPAGSITFRLYGHSGIGSPGANSTNWRIDDLNVFGQSNAVANLPLVGFNSPVSAGLEDGGQVQIPVTMDSAPTATVTVSVVDALTGTASAGDYSYTSTTLTFLSSDTYPYTQFVTITPTADPDYETNETVVLTLSLQSGNANLGFTTNTFTITNDDLPALVINEVDYDQLSTDTDEFIEIKNVGIDPVQLSGLRIVLQNGSGDIAYGSAIIFNSFVLAPGAYYVVGSASVPNVNQVVFTTNGIQNGDPDGLKLTTAAGVVIDQMSYGGLMSTTEGTSATTDLGNVAGISLSRVPDGVDSNNNGADFRRNCSSPGSANVVPDADGDGTPDCLDQCPGGPEPGTICDDGDPATGNDQIRSNCLCAGDVIDCLGMVNGPALPGSMCDDMDPNTINDVYQPNCTCLGEVIDCQGTPGGTALPGTACNDFNPTTFYDVFGEDCNCAGIPCTQNVVIQIDPGTQGSQLGWEIAIEGTAQIVCNVAPGSYPNDPSGGPILETCCLPVGCFTLSVFDSAGDGIAGGGYQLREVGASGRRIIDNTGNFPAIMESSVMGGQDFCLPISDLGLIWSSCDKLDWVPYKYIVCHADPDVSALWIVGGSNAQQPANSGYDFWIFDPNGTYSFRRFRSHNVSDGFSPATANRAAHMKIHSWYNTPLTPHIPDGVLMNVRVRARVNGVNRAFGPACTMKLDAARAACPLVWLLDDPAFAAEYSCGVIRNFGGVNAVSNRIVARSPQFQPPPFAGGTGVRFQFRFRNAERCIVLPPGTSARLYLNWNAAIAAPLVASETYDVDVRVSKDQGATWCVGLATADAASNCANMQPWGRVCSLTIGSVVGVNNGGSSAIAGAQPELTMYPNPNRGDQLFLAINALSADVLQVGLDLYDLTGKRVIARTIPVQDQRLNTTVPLNGDLAPGVYLVNLTAGDRVYTQRLVVF